ncbi:MAG: molybdopterin molybdotransferase MoeA [Campylobacterota bacterium]|nr:molybdopterin molybdotransferase MoeA [Campylobacterota bacterium]
MAISITEAFEILDNSITSLSSEVIPIEESIGRTVSSDCYAAFCLPRFDNSAMDGYAVKCSDQGSIVKSNRVIYAGDASDYTLQEGEAIRIMTGAPTPKGCEAIVPIEEVEVAREQVSLPESIRALAHIRHAGEDLKKESKYISKNDTITAYTLAAFASQGLTHVSVVRKAKIAVFGTGDELRPHYERIEPHQLYNSNAPMFLARAKELGCEVYYVGGSGDTIDSLKECIRQALDADLIITSGGVSVGDKDFTKEAFRQLGMETFFSGIAIKPGKPTTIGKIDNTVVVNLPGNPLAAMVNYELFVKFIIRKLSGASASYLGSIEAIMKEEYKLNPGKYTVILGRYNGSCFVPLPQQSPGMVSPLPQADGLIITTPEVSLLTEGKTVKMMPIKWDFYSKEAQDIFTK